MGEATPFPHFIHILCQNPTVMCGWIKSLG
jgi:hypothetical protein